MKEIKECEVEIERQVKAGKKILLMLDFDGTISPIMPAPEQAYLPNKTRRVLREISQFYPVAIVSGRPLSVVKKKVGVDEFTYAGSHGLEWSIEKKLKLKRMSKRVLSALSDTKKDFIKIIHKYPKLSIEEKPYSFTFHYQFVGRKKMRAFKADLKKFIEPIYKNPLLRVFWDKETVDIIPRLDWNKGEIIRLLYKYFQVKNKKIILPVYAGDSKTDEDAFIALKGEGITIRVGKNKKSAAKYYLKNQRQIDKFLLWLLKNIRKDVD